MIKERSTKSNFFLGEFECEDKTDETEGCQLHGQAQDQCKSWNGNQFVTCPNDTSICTLPQFVDNCRQCDDANHWRCNDGWCIEKSRINDGVADCLDRSDEDSGTPILSIWVFETFSVCFFQDFWNVLSSLQVGYSIVKCCFVFRARAFLSARHYVIT